MATSVLGETGLVPQFPPEILGPAEFDEKRIALRKQWEPVVEAAKQLKVIDAASSEQATEYGRLLQLSKKLVEGHYKPIKSAIDAIKKPVLDAENADIKAIDDQKTQLGSQITKFNAEQEIKRREQERIQQEEEAKRARDEALERAIQLEAEGALEQAEAVLEETVHAPAVFIQRSAPIRTKGQVGKITYSAEVVNPLTLLQAIIDGKLPLQAISINMGFLNSKASLDKEAFSVPGCRLNKSQSTHFRA